MSEKIVNLNVNPCKMCMPMGAMNAFYGIKKCMSILHGSQGCSTYIRRHMATHYNEPVDIASSSLTEEGTVYGGEKSLLKGLENIIRVYQPEVIGVATTCLAETIGEDLNRIIDLYYENHPEHSNIQIIPVHSAGYGGTQYEGFIEALYGIVKAVATDEEKHDAVNIVTSMLSPEDTRYLKNLLELIGLPYILLPDLSDNLDGGFNKDYDKLPNGGTSIEDIKRMGGARVTIELGVLTESSHSPAKYLKEQFGVPVIRLNLPIGIRDNDILIQTLLQLTGEQNLDPTCFPSPLREERSRYLDAMVDSHKHNGEGRAVIFGEPAFVYSTVRLCVENGIMPMVVATGSKSGILKELVEKEIKVLSEINFITDYEILNDVDFETIEILIKEKDVNLMIGNSDGRRIEERLQIPLVRRGFPIHDRVGGQRLKMFGYCGSLDYLDDMTNTVLSIKETSFRSVLYDKYYKEEKMMKTLEEKTASHPCFNGCATGNARIHLPIAPKCNISCNYCLRKYDCPNESRPGVTTSVLTPEQAVERYKEAKAKIPNLTVVGIAGPGDALANFEETKKALTLIREFDKDVTFCLSTNGLMLPLYASELVELGVSHVTVTMNAIDPKIGAKVYRYVNYMGTKFEGESAAAILLANQLTGIKYLTERGLIVKVNIVMLKGINDEHIPSVVKKVKELNGTITNIMQMIPVKGSVFEDLPLVSNQEVMQMRKKCEVDLKQMYHCKQCRADAVGTLGDDRSIEFSKDYKSPCSTKSMEEIAKIAQYIRMQKDIENGLTKDISKESNEIATEKIYRFAAATKSGMLIDQHFGQVTELYIYESCDGKATFKECRKIKQYCEGIAECGDKENKIDMIIETIKDCDGVIAMRIGDSPSNRLKEQGIQIFTTYDKIEDAVVKAADMVKSQVVV